MSSLSIATRCQRWRRIPTALRRAATTTHASFSGQHQQQQPQQQQQRHKSSFLAAMIPQSVQQSVKETVKTSILDKVTKDESKVWSSVSNPNGLNGNHHTVHGRSLNHGTPAVGVNDEISAWHHDTLDDLYLDMETTRYWPDLPPKVRTNDMADPLRLTQDDVSSLSQSIREDLLGTDHPVLNQAASYFFGEADGGKKIRPLMVMLLSRALSDTVAASEESFSPPPLYDGFHTTLFTRPLSWQRHDLPQAQRRLAEISEMIHTASLFHDDVIDGSETRRGKSAVHMVFGNKMAILAGDYLLARASISLARLRHVEVVECMSTIIEHLVRGEVMQMRGTSSTEGSKNERMVYYLKKNYYKTGSLMANSCKSAALLAECPPDLVIASYKYGKHIGMAFQLVDDVLDFEGDVKSMGKPALADLRAGLSTAPVLFAAEEFPELEAMMDRKFRQDGDVEQARELVLQSQGIERTKELARVHAERAMEAVLPWKDSVHRDALINLAYKVVQRTK